MPSCRTSFKFIKLQNGILKNGVYQKIITQTQTNTIETEKVVRGSCFFITHRKNKIIFRGSVCNLYLPKRTQLKLGKEQEPLNYSIKEWFIKSNVWIDHGNNSVKWISIRLDNSNHFSLNQTIIKDFYLLSFITYLSFLNQNKIPTTFICKKKKQNP